MDNIMTYQPQNQNVTSGVLTGCVVSINAGDDTTYDISAGTIVLEDWSDPSQPRMNRLSFPGVVGRTPPNPTTSLFTTILLIQDPADEDLAEIFETEEGRFTATQRRETAPLLTLFHLAGDGVIGSLGQDFQAAYGWTQALNDLSHCRGNCNMGNRVTANGANLQIDKSAGETGQMFFNATVSPWLNPVLRSNPATSPQGFFYQAQDPAGPFVTGVETFDVDPDNYDVNGVITTMPSGNRWQIQPVWFFGQSDTMTVGYGQTVYNSLADALVAVASETHIAQGNTVDAVRIASIIVKRGTTDLSNLSDNVIVNTVG